MLTLFVYGLFTDVVSVHLILPKPQPLVISSTFHQITRLLARRLGTYFITFKYLSPDFTIQNLPLVRTEL